MGLFDIFSGDEGSQAATQAYNAQTAALKKGQKKAVNSLESGAKQAAPNYQQGAAAFAPFQANGVQGSNMLSNALGLNGQQGYDAATGAFHQGPGFQFALDQANQNVMRNQAQTGGLNSGNTLTALSDRAQGLQNQEYNNWISNLQGLSGQGLQGATGQAQELNQLGGLFNTLGQNKATVYQNTAQGLGTAGANLAQNQYAAQNGANQNIWGAITGGLGLGAQLLGLL
jgi:hypothetical protein